MVVNLVNVVFILVPIGIIALYLGMWGANLYLHFKGKKG